jgi:hypothetical protein
MVDFITWCFFFYGVVVIVGWGKKMSKARPDLKDEAINRIARYLRGK